MSYVNFCNSLPTGLLLSNIISLQPILQNAARVITSKCIFIHFLAGNIFNGSPFHLKASPNAYKTLHVWTLYFSSLISSHFSFPNSVSPNKVFFIIFLWTFTCAPTLPPPPVTRAECTFLPHIFLVYWSKPICPSCR